MDLIKSAFIALAIPVFLETRIAEERYYCQHGATTTLTHSIAVAYYSYRFMKRHHIVFSEESLVRGALLHDYFLYDWHKPQGHDRFHGWTHPGIAWKNVLRDWKAHHDPRIENIIRHHMFPFTPVPPKCREAYIVCLADKICSLKETFRHERPYPEILEIESILFKCIGFHDPEGAEILTAQEG